MNKCHICKGFGEVLQPDPSCNFMDSYYEWCETCKGTGQLSTPEPFKRIPQLPSITTCGTQPYPKATD